VTHHVSWFWHNQFNSCDIVHSIFAICNVPYFLQTASIVNFLPLPCAEDYGFAFDLFCAYWQIRNCWICVSSPDIWRWRRPRKRRLSFILRVDKAERKLSMFQETLTHHSIHNMSHSVSLHATYVPGNVTLLQLYILHQPHRRFYHTTDCDVKYDGAL
jgi:hypothetical protein